MTEAVDMRTEEQMLRLIAAVSQADRDSIWRSVFVACDLFDRTARAISSRQD